jgi:hypothetical protein
MHDAQRLRLITQMFLMSHSELFTFVEDLTIDAHGLGGLGGGKFRKIVT